MKLIKLTQGQFAMVDDADFGWLSGHKWQASYCKNNKSFYARRRDVVTGKTVYMHREIVGAKPGEKADHKVPGSTLDNRRRNLRRATSSQNSSNGRIRSCNTSGYKGVHWHKKCGKWQARITVRGQMRSLGLFKNKRQAAKVRNTAARELHGEFARAR